MTQETVKDSNDGKSQKDMQSENAQDIENPIDTSEESLQKTREFCMMLKLSLDNNS